MLFAKNHRKRHLSDCLPSVSFRKAIAFRFSGFFFSPNLFINTLRYSGGNKPNWCMAWSATRYFTPIKYYKEKIKIRHPLHFVYSCLKIIILDGIKCTKHKKKQITRNLENNHKQNKLWKCPQPPAAGNDHRGQTRNSLGKYGHNVQAWWSSEFG